MMDRKIERAMKTVFSVVGCAIAFAACADSGWFSNWPSDARPADISRRIAEQFLTTVPDRYRPDNGYRGNNGYGGGNSIHYSVVSLWVNALECARLTEDKPLENRLVIAFEPYCGVKRHIQPKFKHVDFTIFGALPLEIAILTGDERARKLGMKYADMQWEEPKREDPPPWYNVMSYEERMDWWRKGYSDQTRLWIDDAYMIGALQTQAFRLTGDVKYVERAAKEAVLYLDRLQKPNGLFHHSLEVPFYWGRGNGWMAGAMPQILKYLPEGSEFRPRLMEGYRKMMSSLFSLQRENGMWGQLVDDPESWSESSGTAMFAYAFAEGIRYGWLDADTFGPAMRKAYLALVARMDEWGNVSSVCAGTAAKNDREYYLNRARINGDPHGQAAILWLCRTMLESEKGGEVKASAAQPLPEYYSPREYSDRIQHKYELLNLKADGFRGIWYGNQLSRDEYVYKYSGGLGSYCAGHIPMAVYSKEADKTFFCFGGTDERNSTLLQSVSYFDHKTGLLARPTVVFNKYTIDAHDNAVMNIDDKGYIYIFSSSHGQWRPSAIARSEKPYDISRFKIIWEGNYSYPQPFYVDGKGFMFLHAWYVTDGSRNIGERTNRFMTSNADGTEWSERKLLTHFNEGHYQRAWPFGSKKIGVAFDQHPKGKGLNWRTDVFYMETDDFGKTWKSAAGVPLELPVDRRDNPALALRYEEKNRNVYIKGVKFDRQGRPVVLSIVSKGYRAGPEDGPREWKLAKWTGREWREIDTGIRSGNNYDFAELYIDSDSDWRIIGASEPGPQAYNPGGEIAAWRSVDAGETWTLEKRLTHNSERNQNYPRQPLNVNGGFYAFWADGHGRKPSVSRFYFCDSDLNVYIMPLSFDGDFAKPVPYGQGRRVIQR